MVFHNNGHVRHWYTGTEYYIDEFCIARNKQGLGIGTKFLKDMEQYIINREMTQIFLQTDRNVPAYHFYKKKNLLNYRSMFHLQKKLDFNQMIALIMEG